jgi:CRP/FNR family cyclic AMP-dependent transcriptional regulator
VARGAPRTMGKEWSAVLADVPLFDGLSKRQLGKVASLGVARRKAPLTSIVVKGDKGDSFFVILSGNAVVRRPGRRNVTLGPGDFFGEMALLDGAPRTATVEAANEVEVMQIPRSGFRKMLESDAKVACVMLETLAGRLRATQASPTA